MCKSFSWTGTTLKINNNDGEIRCLIDPFKKEGIYLQENGKEFIMENQANYFIFENEFINQSRNLITSIKKYSDKEYQTTTRKYLPCNTFDDVQANTHDAAKCKGIIENNIIDGQIRELNISINVLNEILDSSDSSRVFLDILILFVLATKSSYDAVSLRSEFKIKDSNFVIDMNIEVPNPIHLYPIYDWIINDEEYEESHSVKLQIIRQVIATKKDINDVEGILEDGKLAYKRIISKKTDDYFEQLNQLKNDFLILSNNENNALRTLNLTFFAWIGYLGIELFNIISKYNGPNIVNYLLWSKGIKKGIIIALFIIAISFIFTSYVAEIMSLRKTYQVIKRIYKDKILFEVDSNDGNKFEKIIKEPKVGRWQIIIFIVIIIILFGRLGIAWL